MYAYRFRPPNQVHTHPSSDVLRPPPTRRQLGYEPVPEHPDTNFLGRKGFRRLGMIGFSESPGCVSLAVVLHRGLLAYPTRRLTQLLNLDWVNRARQRGIFTARLVLPACTPVLGLVPCPLG